jgi:hypothetical protein
LSDLATSSSDGPAADPEAWSRCLVACLRTLAIGAALLYAFLFAVDPYDTGKFGLLGINGVDDRNSITASASRARDPDFDSAIIGNSTALLLNPKPLSEATGLRFVQLSVVGGSPREQLAVLDFFQRHHPHVGALVFVTDPAWCAHAPDLNPRPFPYWLYEDGRLGYARRLLSTPSIEHAFQRLSIGLGLRKRMDPTGTFRSDDVWPAGQFFAKNPPADPAPLPPNVSLIFYPEVARLEAVIKKLPPDLPVVILVPPTFASTVPSPDTPQAAERETCNAALRKLVAGRPHSNFLNYRVDNALTRDRANWVDFIHYRPLIASKISDGIVDSIKQGGAAKADF